MVIQTFKPKDLFYNNYIELFTHYCDKRKAYEVAEKIFMLQTEKAFGQSYRMYANFEVFHKSIKYQYQ